MATINNATNSVVTQYNTLTGGANNTINNVSPGTSGWVLTSNGASAQPTFQAAAGGGSVTSVTGTANQIDVATGTTTPVISLDSALIAPGSVTVTTNFNMPNTIGALTTGVFSFADGTRIHNYGTDNLFIGNAAGNGTLTGTDNVCIGTNSLSALTSGVGNMGIGANCLRHVTSGSSNCGMGIATLTTLTSSTGNTCFGHNSGNLISTGSGGNTSLGYQSLYQVTTGTGNTCIGYQAGYNYTGTEGGNILIGNNMTGTAAESNVTRIGTGQSKCFMSGITGVAVTNPVLSTIDTSTGQMGVLATAPAGAEVVSLDTGFPAWNNSTTKDVVIFLDDFIYYSQATTTIFYITEAVGTASTCTFNNVNPTGNTVGEVQMTTGTTTTGAAQVSTTGNSFAKQFNLAQGFVQADFFVQIPTLSTAAQEFIVTVGIGQQFSAGVTTEPGQAVYFQYNRTTSTNWIGASNDGAGTTTASGGGSVAVGTGYTHLRLTVNAAASTCTFYVDGTNIGTTATHIPASSTTLGLGAKIRKTAGSTSRSLNLDLWRLYINLTTSRWKM